MDTAVINWKQDFEVAKIIGERTHQTVNMAPLDQYIVHMLLLAQLISKEELTAANVGTLLDKIAAVSKAVGEAAKKRQQKRD